MHSLWYAGRTPAEPKICNDKATMLEAHKFAELQCNCGTVLTVAQICWVQCNCGTVPARLTDESGHVYKTDLAIVSDDVARNRMKKGTTFRDSYTKFHVYRTEDDDRPDEVILLEQSLDNYSPSQVERRAVPG